jgi:hypothetical protein
MRRRYQSWYGAILATLLGISALILVGCSSQAPDSAENASAPDMSAEANMSDMVGAGAPQKGVIVSASKAPYCDIVEAYVPADQCHQYADRIGHLQDGLGAFNPPKRMTQDETRLVELNVSRSPATDNPASQIGGPDDQKIPVPMKVGRYMSAKLSGEGFKIEPQGPEDQDLFLATDARWSWRVTALPAATHRLVLTTYVQTPETAGGPLKPMWTRSKTVEVEVSVSPGEWWKQLMSSVGDWAKTTQGTIISLTALVAAIAGLIAAVRALFRPKSAKGEDSPPGGG